MNLQEILADLANQVRRPGFWQAAAGQLAIAAGHQLVASAAEDAEERALTATKDVERLTLVIAEKGEHLRALVVEAIRDGAFDDLVVERARAMDAKLWAQFDVIKTIPDDDGPVGVYEEQNGSEHPAEYRVMDRAAADADLAAALARANGNGAPAGQPDMPPRMAGGLLASIAPHDWAGSGCRGVWVVHWPACSHRPDSRVCQHQPCDECQAPVAVVADDREHAD